MTNAQWRTKSVEDFLKAMYLLQRQATPVTTKRLSAALNITPPSVNDMIKRLAGLKDGDDLFYHETPLLEHLPYKGAKLTPAGEQIALQIIRRHRLLELYLHDKLGYSWDEVHDEAERLEHAMSDMLEERIAAALGHPQFDPHGDPIPDADGVMRQRELIVLTELPIGTPAVISRIVDQTPESLRYLEKLGLTPSTELVVNEHILAADTISLDIDGNEQIISRTLARQIMVMAGV